MIHPIRTLVQDYEWIHLSLGLFGNVAFLVGSVLFLPMFEGQSPSWTEMDWKTLGVWLFIIGTFFMFIGALGNLLVKLSER
ncbi:YrhK family protein [Limimaricola litoreus]|uniref:YrhK family protein n=1 Tax=Limimaricola litoreus TaxID=2955316 RepID=A0A9X2FQA9_9RHOB|nr:YrhK family protein [Limimaricola litoreus]MCP1169202.1 YrhK family protein [Limimaricola litoreus]